MLEVDFSVLAGPLSLPLAKGRGEFDISLSFIRMHMPNVSVLLKRLYTDTCRKIYTNLKSELQTSQSTLLGLEML